MAVTKGRLGVVEIDTGGGDQAILEVVSFTYDDAIEQIDVKAMGDTFKRTEDGLREAGGQIVVNWDQADANGQAAMIVGINMGLKLYPGGKTPVGTHYITSVGNDSADQVKLTTAGISSEVDGITGRTFDYRGGLLPVVTV